MLRSSQTLKKVLFVLHLRLELASGTYISSDLECHDTWTLGFVVWFLFETGSRIAQAGLTTRLS